MKFIADCHSLKNSLSRLSQVASRNKTHPLLGHILIDAKENSLMLTTTDMMMTMSETVDVEVSQQGSITVPAHTLLEILKKIPEGLQINFECEPSEDNSSPRMMVITTANSKFQISTLPAEDFPSDSKDDLQINFSISAQQFENLIKSTAFAISSEDTRQYLNGIFLNSLPDIGIIRAVGTNGHQMAISETELPASDSPIPSVIIPAKLVKLLTTTLPNFTKEPENIINITMSNSKIHVNIDRIDIFSRLVDDNYPDYTKVIPQNNNTNFTVSTKTLLDAIERVVIISNENKPSVKLIISNDTIDIHARGDDYQTANENIKANYNGEEITISFNEHCLSDILKNCGKEEISVSIKDASSAVLINAEEPSRFIIMPSKF